MSQRPSAASTGVWVGVATISMSFAAYTSALVMRQGASSDWFHFRLPPILYLNTLLLLVSSATLEMARRNHAGHPTEDAAVIALPGPASRTLAWMNGTLALGLLFVVGQAIAWRQIAAQGLFLSTNPSSAFFYILTVLHAVHVLGGLGGLLYARHRLHRGAMTTATPVLAAASRYWHFMAVLWVYLLLLLVVRL